MESDSMSRYNPTNHPAFSWGQVLKLLALAFPWVLAAFILLLRGEFANAGDVRLLEKGVATINGDVAVLKEADMRNRKEHETFSATLQAVSNGQSATQATLVELIKGNERILRRLDTLSDRRGYNETTAGPSTR